MADEERRVGPDEWQSDRDTSAYLFPVAMNCVELVGTDKKFGMVLKVLDRASDQGAYEAGAEVARLIPLIVDDQTAISMIEQLTRAVARNRTPN